MIPLETHLQIGSLLFEGLDQIDLTAPFEVFSRLPNSTYRIFAKTTEALRDMNGLRLLSARTLDAETVEQIVDDSLSGAPEAKLAWPTESIREDISAEVPKIAVLTLVVAGERDQIDPVKQHRREVLPRIPNSRLQVIPGSVHLIPIDEPVALAHAINAFVTALKA